MKDEDGETVAMKLAFNGIIPPKEWHHLPRVKDDYDETVAMKLALNGLIPPKEWKEKWFLKPNFLE